MYFYCENDPMCDIFKRKKFYTRGIMFLFCVSVCTEAKDYLKKHLPAVLPMHTSFETKTWLFGGRRSKNLRYFSCIIFY